MSLATKQAALKALSLDQSTTMYERRAAAKRLAAHIAKHGTEEVRPPSHLRWADTTRVIGCRWRRGRQWSPALWNGMAPDAKVIVMTICTVRKAHECIACVVPIHKGSRAWRTLAYHGNHRMDRLCCACWAPDPEAKPQLEEQP